MDDDYTNRETLTLLVTLRETATNFSSSLWRIRRPSFSLTLSNFFAHFRWENTALLSASHVAAQLSCVFSFSKRLRDLPALLHCPVIFSMTRSAQLPKILDFLFVLKAFLQRPLHSLCNTGAALHFALSGFSVVLVNPFVHRVVNSTLRQVHC